MPPKMKPTQRMLAAQDTFTLTDTEPNGFRMVARRSTVQPRSSAPTVVLLGGTALSGRYLLPVAVEVAHRYPACVPDLPGRGASEAPKTTLTVQEHADHLVAWMSSVGLDRAALLGNSMGCQIAVETAVRHPDRVSHVILQAPTTDPDARSLPRQLGRLLRDGTHEPASLGPVEVVDWFRAGARYAVDQARATLQHRVEERLPLVPCPALVVRGSLDPVVPQSWAEKAARLLYDGYLCVIPGAAHAMVYTHALELARVTDAFLHAFSPGDDAAPATASDGPPIPALARRA